jgi:arginyl-tRNA synthetase
VLSELLPNRLCDYLYELSVKFTDFVTKCHVLNVAEPLMQSRLLICLATNDVMATCFRLLGIGTLERI